MTFVFAHRGSRCNTPENTLAAFKEAIRVFSDGIELDVRLTKDKEVVVIHDATIDRTTSGTGYVKDITLREIQSYDAGSWFSNEFSGEVVPSLRQVLKLLEDEGFKGVLNIEIKADGYLHKGLEKRVSLIVNEKKRPFEIIYSSFSRTSLRLIHRYDRDKEKYLLIKDVPKNKKRILKAQSNKMYQGVHSSLGKSLRDVKFLENLEKKTRIWTINKDEDMLYCFRQNVEGLITDYPEKAIRLRDKDKENSLLND